MATMGSCSNTWTARFPQVATKPPLNDTRALISFPALTCTDSLQFFSALIQAPFYESLSNSLMSSISAGTAFIWSYVIKPYMVDGDILSKPVWSYMIKPYKRFDHIWSYRVWSYTTIDYIYIWSNPIYDQTLYLLLLIPITVFLPADQLWEEKNDGGGFTIVLVDNWIYPLWPYLIFVTDPTDIPV